MSLVYYFMHGRNYFKIKTEMIFFFKWGVIIRLGEYAAMQTIILCCLM